MEEVKIEFLCPFCDSSANDGHEHSFIDIWPTKDVGEYIDLLRNEIEIYKVSSEEWKNAYSAFYNERETKAELELKRIKDQLIDHDGFEFFKAFRIAAAFQQNEIKSFTTNYHWFRFISTLINNILYSKELTARKEKLVTLAATIYNWWRFIKNDN